MILMLIAQLSANPYDLPSGPMAVTTFREVRNAVNNEQRISAQFEQKNTNCAYLKSDSSVVEYLKGVVESIVEKVVSFFKTIFW